MTFTEMALGFIAAMLLMISVQIGNISARLRKQFPTDSEAELDALNREAEWAKQAKKK